MIEKLKEEHIAKIDKNFIEQNWGSRLEILEKYLEETFKNERIVLVDVEDNDCRGYITLILNNKNSFYDIPEISDFNVFEKYQKRGIGHSLLNNIIEEAKIFNQYVRIGVGLNSNYGEAQKLYVKNGFIPDGKGVYYKGKVLRVNEICKNDDNLALYFLKKIR